jgi:hypothetical protein
MVAVPPQTEKIRHLLVAPLLVPALLGLLLLLLLLQLQRQRRLLLYALRI